MDGRAVGEQIGGMLQGLVELVGCLLMLGVMLILFIIGLIIVIVYLLNREPEAANAVSATCPISVPDSTRIF